MSENKIIKLPTEVDKFFEGDVLDFTEFPDKEISDYFKEKFKNHRVLDLTTVESETKRKEIKDIFKSCIGNRSPYAYKSKYFNYLFYLTELANMFEKDSFLEISEDKCKTLYIQVIEKNKISKEAIKIISSFLFVLFELKDTRTGMDRDIWYFKDYNIDETRMNKANAQNSLNFKRIVNTEHRNYIKIWFKYMLGCSELSISTIMNIMSPMVKFSNYFSNKSIFEITEADVTSYIATLTISNNYINSFVNSLSDFYKYMAIKGLTDKPSPVQRHHLKKEKYVPADNLVSEYVILQIFGKLHELDHVHKCMYLINYCTGMRVSDLCQLKVDCLYKDNTDGHYIRVNNCQKMQKTTINLIPPSLYKLLQEQVEKVVALPYKEEYLFPAPSCKNKPFQAQTFRKDMQKWCKSKGIKNNDGTDYEYTTHSYRHTLSTDLFQNYDVDLQVIQLAVLWHQEIQMTLTYAQRGDEYNRALHEKYISNVGADAPLEREILDSPESLHKKALANGYCNYPTRLGACPNADICLNCQFFRTSRRFLSVHEEHLKEVQKNIVISRMNGWNNNLATDLETEKKLKQIIETLQNLE